MNSFTMEMNTPEFDTVADLAENLVYRLPGIDPIMLRKTIQSVYREFCSRSCAVVTKRRMNLCGDNAGHISINPSISEFEIESVFNVTIDGRPIPNDGSFEWNMGCVHLPRPALGKSEVELYCVEIPKIGTESAPYGFVGKYGDAICSGVIARLMAMSGKAWSDSSQAASETVRYENAINEARMKYYGIHMQCGTVNYAESFKTLL